MSTLSSGRDEDSRSNTFSDVTERERRARFPSLRLDPQEFVSPGYSEPAPRFPPRRPSEVYAKLTVTERVWYWLCGISKKVWLIGGGIVLLFLSIIIVGVILIFVLPNHNSTGTAYSQAFTRTPTPTSPSPPTSPPFPYPKIVNTLTEAKWFPIGFMESIVPDTRGYEYRGRILAYNSTATYLILNSTHWLPLPNISEPNDCNGCKLLAATDNCLHAGVCNNRESIFCCQNCTIAEQVCLIHGSSITTAGENIEWRISSDGNQLMLTNAFNIESLAAIQTTRANGTASFKIGPLKFVQIPPKDAKSSLTLDPNFSNVTDLVIWINTTGFLMIQYEGTTFPVNLGLSGAVFTIDTWAFQSHALIAIVQEASFEIVRVNLQNNCISKIPASLRYSFDGTWKGSFWAEDNYYLWYNDNRGLDGISLIRYGFDWPSDGPICPYNISQRTTTTPTTTTTTR